jgi:hypothetical protein
VNTTVFGAGSVAPGRSWKKAAMMTLAGVAGGLKSKKH